MRICATIEQREQRQRDEHGQRVDRAGQDAAEQRDGGEAETVDPRSPLEQPVALFGDQVHDEAMLAQAVTRTGGATRNERSAEHRVQSWAEGRARKGHATHPTRSGWPSITGRTRGDCRGVAERRLPGPVSVATARSKLRVERVHLHAQLVAGGQHEPAGRAVGRGDVERHPGADLVLGERVRVAAVRHDRDADLGRPVLVDRDAEVELRHADAVGTRGVQQGRAVDRVERDGAVGAGGLDRDDELGGSRQLRRDVQRDRGQRRDLVHAHDQAGGVVQQVEQVERVVGRRPTTCPIASPIVQPNIGGELGLDARAVGLGRAGRRAGRRRSPGCTVAVRSGPHTVSSVK